MGVSEFWKDYESEGCPSCSGTIKTNYIMWLCIKCKKRGNIASFLNILYNNDKKSVSETMKMYNVSRSKEFKKKKINRDKKIFPTE